MISIRRPARAARPSPTSWAEMIERGMRMTLLVSVLVGAASTAAIAPEFYPHPDEAGVTGLVLVAAAHVLILWTLVRRRVGWWPAVGVTALLTVGLALAATHMANLPELSDTWWPRTILIATPSYLIISHRRGWILAAELIAVNATVHTLAWHPSATLPGLTRTREIAAETGQFVAYAAIALLAVGIARRAGRDADAAVADGRPGRQATATGRLESTQAEEADRFVHDEVLQTLRLIAMDRAVVPAAAALDAARSLRRLLEMQQEAPSDDGFVEQLRTQTADLGIAVTVTGAAGLSLPRDIAAALIAAVRECLRNVEKHAGTDRAEVAVRRSRFALSVTVRDNGRGFDAARLSDRLGLRGSVIARLEAIGGNARIVSVPGRGTTVHLRWSPIPQESYAPRQLGGGVATSLFPSMGRLILPSLLQGMWAAALLATLTRVPGLALLATVVVCGAGWWAIYQGLRDGLTARHSMALGLVAWAGTAVSVLLLPPGSAHPRLLWLAVTVTGLASVISVFRPLREAVVVSAGIMILTVSLLLWTQPAVPLKPNLPIILAPVVTVGIAIAVRMLIDRCAYEIWTNEERIRDLRSGLVADDFFRSRLDHRLLGNASRLIALLDEVIADPAVLASAATSARALRLEQALRDLLGLSVEPTLSEVMARLFTGGWTVRSRWSADAPPAVQRAAARALAALPDPAPAQAAASTVTLTASERGATWRLSVLVHPADESWVEDYDPGADWQVDREDGMHASCTLPMPADAAPSEAPLPAADRLTPAGAR